jgi:hypothetical protein
MERSLDEYGSIVIKTPDVWGESRLMRHRSDVENQLEARLNSFDFRINAIQSTRDAAFLATAIALQEQIGGGVGALTTDSTSTATQSLISDPNVTGTDKVSNIVPRREFSTPGTFTGTSSKAINVAIEPVIELDQLNRYLQHLNELRRLNEGDDNADTPGYALNLIRIPVSVLPGRKTEEGFGAEVQITIDPYISDEVLPLAFKDFVINGLVDRISFEVFEIARTSDIDRLRTACRQSGALLEQSRNSSATRNEESLRLTAYQDESSTDESETSKVLDPVKLRRSLNAGEFSPYRALEMIETENETASGANAEKVEEAKKIVFEYLPNLLANVNQQDLSVPTSHTNTVDGDTTLRLALLAYDSLTQTNWNARFPFEKEKPTEQQVPPSHRVEHGLTLPEVQALLRRESLAAYDFLSQPNSVGLWELFSGPELARQIKEHRRDLVNSTQSEFKPDLVGLDEKYATGDIDSSGQLVVAVDPRGGVHEIRNAFFREMQRSFPQARNSVTEALVWQILVEAALVNDQLCKDMKETATLKNCPCVNGDWMQFYGPNPAPEARMAFREYVKCKWPVHVFALDPVTQDQNIADSFSQRREMQMALAIAAANGGLGGQALSRFVRRMEYDLETIELNRTAIAFSHGDNTFGWRFYPRVQSPPVPSNLRATVNDLLIGGQSRDSLVRTRKLEPGIRECTALVVMPSFVPQVTVDVRSNYFRLAKHTPVHQFMHRKPGYESSMELSRELTELRRLQQQCINDAHLYRDGEVFRLCKAVERLDDRLPLQTHNVTVPWENDLGGFEVFQSGASMLEPELHGWYGPAGITVLGRTPGRNAAVQWIASKEELAVVNLKLANEKAKTAQDAAEQAKLEARKTTIENDIAALKSAIDNQALAVTSTSVFLVGKNFSVLNCRVIAGGVDVTNTIQVINRNLLQVQIPSNVSVVTTEHESNQQFVVVHLATPHGATSRLLIPVDDSGEEKSIASEVTAAQKAATDAAKQVEAMAARVPTKLTWELPRKSFTATWKGGKMAKLMPGDRSLSLAVTMESWAAERHLDGQPVAELTGSLYVWVTSGEIKEPIMLGEVIGGQTGHTMDSLLSHILKDLEDNLPDKPEKDAKLTIRGGVKFNAGQPFVVFDDTLEITLSVNPTAK